LIEEEREGEKDRERKRENSTCPGLKEERGSAVRVF
jgi:hypothetical protein